jgi:acyl CoA:acetate/3-ketoacid CoA transferase alpha subunit
VATRYYVTSFNETNINLRKQMSIATVIIPRANIASVRRSGLTGFIRVETNGGKVYEVLPGTRGEAAQRTLQAFGMEERGAVLRTQREELKVRRDHAKDLKAELAAGAARAKASREREAKT